MGCNDEHPTPVTGDGNKTPVLDVRKPPLDKGGQFWVYKDGTALEPSVPPYGIPYVPYGWMPAESAEMLNLDMEHTENPHSGKMCIAVEVKWDAPWWCGVGFISGPDSTMPKGPWWGKTPDGWYYNLTGLKKKRFVFHLRGERGGEKVQWKVGFLAGEKYGDSLSLPAVTKWLELKKEWERFELDISKEDLSRVCSLCFVLSQVQQPDKEAPVVFYADDLYFE